MKTSTQALLFLQFLFVLTQAIPALSTELKEGQLKEGPEKDARGGITRGAFADVVRSQKAEAPGAALKYAQRALATSPQHVYYLLSVALAHARANQPAEALRALGTAAGVGLAYDLEAGEAWDALKGHPDFSKTAQRLRANGEPRLRGEVVATASDVNLFPEGIAHDAKTGDFFLSSLKAPRIVRLGADGLQRDFTGPEETGLYPTLGMKVDAGRRGLWVVSMANEKGPDVGHGGVFHFDVDTGKLRAKYLLEDPSPEHFLNDVVVTAGGEVYVTDSNACAVYRVDAEAGALELVHRSSEFNYWNGIALSKDEKRLYMTGIEGVAILDLDTRTVKLLELGANMTVPFGDGLYFHENSLIVIQNSPVLNNRVARYFLDAAGTRAERVEILHAGLRGNRLPYTGVVVDRSFYFNATSPLNLLDEVDPSEAVLASQIIRLNF